MLDQSNKSQVEQIIRRNEEAARGYLKFKGKMDSPRIRSLFVDCAERRRSFNEQINTTLEKVGNAAVKEYTTSLANAHRYWTILRADFASNEDHVIIEEVIRGENYAVENYNDVIKELPTDSIFYELLINQRNALRTNLERIESLEAAVSES